MSWESKLRPTAAVAPQVVEKFKTCVRRVSIFTTFVLICRRACRISKLSAGRDKGVLKKEQLLRQNDYVIFWVNV